MTCSKWRVLSAMSQSRSGKSRALRFWSVLWSGGSVRSVTGVCRACCVLACGESCQCAPRGVITIVGRGRAGEMDRRLPLGEEGCSVRWVSQRQTGMRRQSSSRGEGGGSVSSSVRISAWKGVRGSIWRRWWSWRRVCRMRRSVRSGCIQLFFCGFQGCGQESGGSPGFCGCVQVLEDGFIAAALYFYSQFVGAGRDDFAIY